MRVSRTHANRALDAVRSRPRRGSVHRRRSVRPASSLTSGATPLSIDLALRTIDELATVVEIGARDRRLLDIEGRALIGHALETTNESAKEKLLRNAERILRDAVNIDAGPNGQVEPRRVGVEIVGHLVLCWE